MITVSEAARKEFLSVLSTGPQSLGLRVTVQGVGSPHVQYGLHLVEKGQEKADDIVVELDGVKFFVDPGSVPFVDGLLIDFVEGLMERGFKLENPKAPAMPRPTGPVAEAILQLLDNEINPAVAAHGGHIDLIDYKDHRVYVRMGGGCQGCGMANVTLRQGIETLLREQLPEVHEIIDVTDHAGGTNPYYEPSK